MYDFPAIAVVVSILLLMVGTVVAACAFIDAATRFRRFPNWSKATRASSVPHIDRSALAWQECYYRDEPGRELMNRRISVASEGLLVRDHSPFVFPRPRTILIPWTSLSNPKEVTIPLYYLRLWRHAVELEVKGTKMTIVVSKQIWHEVQRNVAESKRKKDGSNLDEDRAEDDLAGR